MELGLLVMRLAVGGTVAAHGAQKLLSPRRGGLGIDATAGFLDALGFRPPRAHAWVVGVAELAGGLGLAVGLLTPLAAAAVIGVMVAAIGAAHLSNGFFSQSGGLEYPLVLGSGATALALTGPGRWSLDHVLGWSFTSSGWSVGALCLGLGSALIVLGARAYRRARPPAQPRPRTRQRWPLLATGPRQSRR